MRNTIRILLVEDDDADAEMIHAVLRQGGLPFILRHAANESDFTRELQQHAMDVILCDHGFPSFDGFKALELARTHYPEVPFIFVTGALGEDVAIASFKNGATDYILKSHLTQLPHAVERALREAEDRAARKQLEQDRDQLIRELKEVLTMIKPLTGLLPVCAVCKRIRDYQHGWQPMEAYLQTHADVALTHELCPECETKISPALLNRGQAYTEFAADG
jgi:DNA-binding NtrC family response regulator